MNESQHLAQPRTFSDEDDMNMWRFLIAQETPSGPCKIWKEYKAHTGTSRTAQCLYNRFKYTLSPNLHRTNLDMQTKVNLYKKLKLVVDKEYAEILKREMGIEVDEQGCIIEDTIPEERRRAAPKRQSNAGGGPRTRKARLSYSPPPQIQAEEPVNRNNEVTLPGEDVEQQGPQIDAETFLASLKSVIAESVKEATKDIISVVLAEQKKAAEMAAIESTKTSARICLSNLKTLVAHHNSPAMKDIERRIDAALLKCSISDQQLPADNLQGVVDLALRMVGC